MTTLLALVRFKPVPPANVEIRKTKTSGSVLNWSMSDIPMKISAHSRTSEVLESHDLFVSSSHPNGKIDGLRTFSTMTSKKMIHVLFEFR